MSNSLFCKWRLPTSSSNYVLLCPSFSYPFLHGSAFIPTLIISRMPLWADFPFSTPAPRYLVKNHEELFCLKYVPISSGPTAAVKTEVTMDPQTTKVNKDEVLLTHLPLCYLPDIRGSFPNGYSFSARLRFLCSTADVLHYPFLLSYFFIMCRLQLLKNEGA